MTIRTHIDTLYISSHETSLFCGITYVKFNSCHSFFRFDKETFHKSKINIELSILHCYTSTKDNTTL